MTPTPKDVAEFYRFGLQVGVCDLREIVSWVDSIIAAEPSPHLAFLDLSISGTQPVSTVISLLGAVPGVATSGLSGRLLLGRCYRAIRSGESSANDVLLRLHGTFRAEDFTEGVFSQIENFECSLYLACDGSFGTPEEVAREFTEFLTQYADETPSAK